MKASATSERNEGALPSGAPLAPAARTDSMPIEDEMNESAAPNGANSTSSDTARPAAATPEAADAVARTDAAAKAGAAARPAVARTLSPAANAKAPARAKASEPAAPLAVSDAAVQTRLDQLEASEQEPQGKAANLNSPVIKSEETQTGQDDSLPWATPPEATPQDAKIQDVKTAETKTGDVKTGDVRIGEAKTGEPRAMNGNQGARPLMPVRASAKEENFVEGDFVVYPTHGVGKVEKIAVEDIAGHRLELIHITFEENRMTLRVPVAKARTAGLRKLATQAKFDEALAVLRGRARIKRTMWSRRAQEYEAKINSGDPIAIAEVVRDLHRNAGQPDQSFSERQIYESAMDRLAAELAALDATDKMTAAAKLVNFLKAA